MARKMVVNIILRLEWEVTDRCCAVLVDFLKLEIKNEENDVEEDEGVWDAVSWRCGNEEV